MAISVECESCGAGFKVADTFAGKRGKCPKCGAVFTARAVGPASSSPAATAQRKPGAGSSVADLSPQSPAANQPGTSQRQAVSGSSSNIRPAGRGTRTAGPPSAPVRAVPVGSVAEAIPVGGLPGESSVGKAIVRPAMATGVAVGKSTYGHAKKYKRKKGTPVIMWVIIVVGGISATAGWIYVGTREAEKSVVQAAPAKNTNLSGKLASDKKPTEGAKAASASDATEEADAAANGAADVRRLSVVPEADTEVEGGSEENLDAALAGEGDLKSKIRNRRTATTRAGSTKSATASTANEADAAAVPVKSAPVTAEELNELAEACKQNAWKADSKEQYAQLAALASGMMNYADDAARDVALKLLNGPLTEIVWTTERVSRINRNAARELNKVGAGCFLVAEVTEQVDSGALLKLVSTESLVKIEMMGSQLALARPGKTFLLIGSIKPESYDLPESESGEARRARVIDAMFRMGITEIYDREASTIGPAGGGE